jgi:hypothetical protein
MRVAGIAGNAAPEEVMSAHIRSFEVTFPVGMWPQKLYSVETVLRFKVVCGLNLTGLVSVQGVSAPKERDADEAAES